MAVGIYIMESGRNVLIRIYVKPQYPKALLRRLKLKKLIFFSALSSTSTIMLLLVGCTKINIIIITNQICDLSAQKSRCGGLDGESYTLYLSFCFENLRFHVALPLVAILIHSLLLALWLRDNDYNNK